MEKRRDNVFAKIIRKEIPTDIVYENEHVLAFRDIAPQAPIHILILPKKALVDVSSCTNEDCEILGELILAARDLAKKFGVEKGLRLVINEGEQGGQTVPHLHVHLLAGRSFNWPPG